MDRKKFIKTGLLAVSGFYFLNADLFQAMQPKTDSLEGNVIDAPILIVGSGYGGAVSALRLCEAGKKSGHA
ncbi:hypothetical protein [Chryseobacterium carnipullorum]|uniref:Cholesterol oxidase n=1 Tax=Chryseobacterium carnipullorum TaxID=1124835 RepID=A0A376EFZ3_CHRCU|nr:hypothetical protein [Chryseobacterium carnipullorum]STD07082.1 Uncharacterised protein [Chryseobacterium carnipullorum]